MSENEGVKKTFANNLKYNRLAKKWSQAKLAELVGVNSTSTIGNWEAGIATPDYDKLCFLADLFETSIDSLMGRQNRNVAELGLNKGQSPEGELLEKYNFCDEIGQDAIRNCIEHQYLRCTTVPTGTGQKKNTVTPRARMFISEDDKDYDLMKEKMVYLKKLRKNARKSCSEITQYLWGCGYGDDICIAYIMDIFGVGLSGRVPNSDLYNDIEAFLKGNYRIVSRIKNV